MITHGRFCSLTIAYLLNYSAPHKVRPHSNPRGWTFNFFDHLRKFDRISSRVIVSIKLLIESKLYVSLISLTSLFHWHEFPFRNSYVLTLFRQPGAVATEEKSSIEHYCSLMVHPFDTSEFNEKCEAQGLNLDQHSYTLLACCCSDTEFFCFVEWLGKKCESSILFLASFIFFKQYQRSDQLVWYLYSYREQNVYLSFKVVAAKLMWNIASDFALFNFI